MPSPIVLDTDVVSKLLKRQLPPSLGTKLTGRQFLITFVTLGELTKWAEIYGWGPARRARLDDWLDNAAVVPYHENVAHTWGLISAHAHRRGQRSDGNDSWIAASCLAYGLPLATLNVKHYGTFATHERLELLTSDDAPPS
ncbi:type II toxin-antitoxin system VapC family toxin [Amycolatopsis nigrescens]|uniref:type II toxin-antitoxin system VapC family toxin n=1 Tax=Amycolatopsis nigrescens TaxID=381445 RepID=UPI00036E23CC|nr:type II toxin-antitoxin system VapC family toxin [Amycolatopsis nigrescens]